MITSSVERDNRDNRGGHRRSLIGGVLGGIGRETAVKRAMTRRPLRRRIKALIQLSAASALMASGLVVLSVAFASAQPASWTVVPTPSITSGYDVGFSSVSCASASFCVAVGSFVLNSNYTPQTLIETWNGTTWSLTPSKNSSSSERNDLFGVSCVNAQLCVAVGVSSTGSLLYPTYHTLVETWNGTSWSITQSPNPSSTETATLSGISCVSITDCKAVGWYDNASGIAQTLAETWNGSSWSIIASPNPSTVATSELSDVSCAYSGYCTAVGSYNAPNAMQTLIETWNGTSWSITQSPSPSATENAVLRAISCTSQSYCVAVGRNDAAPSMRQTLIETWNGASWSITQSPDTSASTSNVLYGVSCVSAQGSTSCVAVGYYEGQGGWQTLIESYDGVSWAITESPNSSASHPASLDGVTCTSSSSCVAVGGAHYDALVLTGSSVPATPFNVTTTSLPHAVVGQSYSAGLGTTGGVSPYKWSLSSGSLPQGLSLSASGVISGVATKLGTTTFVVSVTDSSSPPQSAKGSVSITVVAAPVLSAKGYWEVASDGGLFAFGDAHFYGSMGAKPLNKPIVGIATTPDGKGYWEVASDGGLFAFGDAHFYGSMGAKPLNKPIVGIATTPDGKGYWEVASDGGLFAFGDAHFYGSMGAKPLNKPIVGIATTPDGKGYWEVASDGGLFAFGDAHFYGSMGAKPLNKPIVGIAATPDGMGYWEVASDGGLFAFGDAHFYGSMGAKPLNKPIVGIATYVVAG